MFTGLWQCSCHSALLMFTCFPRRWWFSSSCLAQIKLPLSTCRDRFWSILKYSKHRYPGLGCQASFCGDFPRPTWEERDSAKQAQRFFGATKHPKFIQPSQATFGVDVFYLAVPDQDDVFFQFAWKACWKAWRCHLPIGQSCTNWHPNTDQKALTAAAAAAAAAAAVLGAVWLMFP